METSSVASRTVTVVIVGGGAAGLTAAMYLARAGVTAEVFDQDRSILKRAQLNNLPGVDSLEGRHLLQQLRAGLSSRNVAQSSAKVDDIESIDGGFIVRVADGSSVAATYVVLASGQGTVKFPSLALETTAARQPFVKVNVVTDKWGASSVPGVWAAGVVAGWPSQAAICAGSGANVAIEIASLIKGEFWVDHDDTTLAGDPSVDPSVDPAVVS
jgi:thioredoxin reductase (NADPH)